MVYKNTENYRLCLAKTEIVRYEMFVKAYNETREHGGINGLTPPEMFLQRLIKSDTYTKKKQESVTHVGKQNCYLSL